MSLFLFNSTVKLFESLRCLFSILHLLGVAEVQYVSQLCLPTSSAIQSPLACLIGVVILTVLVREVRLMCTLASQFYLVIRTTRLNR